MIIMEGTERAFATDMVPTHFVNYILITAFEHAWVLKRHSELSGKSRSKKLPWLRLRAAEQRSRTHTTAWILNLMSSSFCTCFLQ